MELDTHLPHERLIICHTLYSKNQDGLLGFVQPIAEIIDNKLVTIERENFCTTMKVFITSHYGELERSYPDRKFFQLKIRLSEKNSDNVNPDYTCKYVATNFDASPIKNKDAFEIVEGQLPIPNSRVLVTDELPGTSFIFVDDGTAVYGPFKWRRVDADSAVIKLDFLDTHLPSVNLLPYQIYKIDSNKLNSLKINILMSNRHLIQSLPVALSGASVHDYSSDEDIVKYCAKIAGDQGLRILERSRIDQLLTIISRNSKLDIDLNRNRLSRLTEIVEITQRVRDDVAKSMASFLSSEQGRPIVQGFIEQHESVFIDKLRKEREDQITRQTSDLTAELTKTEARVAELNDKKNKLNDDIQRLTEEHERGADLSQVYAQSDEALRIKNAELEKIKVQLDSWSLIHKKALKIDELNEEAIVLERLRDKERERLEQAKAATNEILATMSQNDASLQRRLAELKPFVEAINGSFFSTETVPDNLSTAIHNLTAGSTTSRQKEVILAMQSALDAQGRYLKEYEVANLLITIQQSFLTIFAGLPGTGKTSLGRLVAETQNIKSRLREVAVSRGWTSQKDLIGYFNPLTSRFQAANTGMYSFLKSIGSETHADRAMAYVLLDEANLSPIEHYWSSFMGLSDNQGDRHIILGNEKILIPDNLRFLATINYDGTTEPLSPRLINRAPVIILDIPSGLSNIKNTHELTRTQLPISALQMKELFGLSVTTPELNVNERAIYEAIKKILLDSDPTLGRPVSISPRKENMIQQYCAKARMLMNVDNDMMALDFAVQQHILPLIQGNGGRFAKRLNELNIILINNDLPVSARILQRMIAFGEADLQTYDFFCW